jgi:hypothetical protein
MAQRILQVCGDPTVDWLTIRSETESGLGPFFWVPNQPAPEVGLSVQPGGSALITSLLQAMIPHESAQVRGVTLDAALLDRPISPITHSWTVWQRQGKKDERSSFRIAEWSGHESGEWDYARNAASGVPDLLVIEDSGLGFRRTAAGWPESLCSTSNGRPQHVLIKFSLYGNGKRSAVLQKILDKGLADRTTILTALSDVRACEVKVAESLSWERILEEVVAAVHSRGCPFVKDGSGELAFRQVIVTIGAAGAILISQDRAALIFDRAGQEGDFERQYKGSMMGYNTAVLGALASAWVESSENIDWEQAVLDGVALARYLHLAGYAVTRQSAHAQLQFPFAGLAEAYAKRNSPPSELKNEFARVWNLGVFEDSAARARSRPGAWTILQQAVLGNSGGTGAGSLLAEGVCDCARLIARQGPQAALANVPVETIGKWRSADRHEIEGVRSVKNAMQEYLQLKRPETPLAVAVFGPPGAGKSFAIKEVAKDLGVEKDAQLTFNLSQFECLDELVGAFHQIRDVHLKGMTPLVFWDEFDTPSEGKPLGWLRYFLAPIQDGQFSDRGRSHPTGGGIYVFAGGTCRSFQEFAHTATEADRAAKKPDFVSRLRAYVDVKGPNGDPNNVEDGLFLVRRAFLFNAFLERHAPQLKANKQFQVGDGVLDAFLRTTKYHHGARSMESIVTMSALKGRRKFELSSLPPEHLLAMHVDAADFAGLTQLGHREMLRVGITGHVGLDPTKMMELENGIGEAIRHIEQAFPNRYLTVFSPLAVGADRLVARKLLEREASRLIAVLPVPADDYVDDFGSTDLHHVDYASAELRHEFRHWISERAIEVIPMTPSASRNEAYEKTGFYIAEHCDVMIAIWDGLPSQGRGGTADVVAHARALGKPISHVWAGNFKKEETKRTDVGQRNGTVEYINFPAGAKIAAGS